MTDFIKQYDSGHKVQRLYIHWDVSTQCNFKCSYCYAMKEYGDEWGKIDRWDKQQQVIKSIGRATLPVFLGLLGGEPTLHPHYTELVEGCHDAISKHIDGRLYVTTNGSKDSAFFKTHKYYNNMYFLWSFHTEYEHKYGAEFCRLLDNIRIIKDKGFKCKVNVMLTPKKELWPKIHKFVDELEKIGSIEIHPHFLYANGDVHIPESYNSEFYTEFKRFDIYPSYFTYEDAVGSKTVYNDYNLFKRELTGFKGWKCWNNNYEISYEGIVHKVCFEGAVNLLSDPFYFKKISSIVPVKCPHGSCNCDGLLKIYKEKT